jgi:MarR family transcriptional regulator, organic hydroperoxide resistance regulator
MVKHRTLLPRSAMLKLDNQVCFALYSTSLTMTKLYKPALDRLGLTYPQYLAMLVLWEANELSVSELGQRLFLDSGTLTPLLKRLESAGWLKRERDAADERRVIVSLTPEGRRLRDKAAGVPELVASAAQCSLSELVDLKKRLQKLRTNLSARLDSPVDEAA